MDLLILSDQLNTCFESSSEVHQLYAIVITYKADQPIKDSLDKKNAPPAVARILNGEPLLQVLKSVAIPNPHEAYRAVFRWLDLVLYTTCDYLPCLNEKNAHNAAIAHPVSVWLYKEHQSVEACCYIGMYLTRLVSKKDLPVVLVKLPELVERFRAFILPKMVEFHTSAADQLKQLHPDYMALGRE